ncbi:hypothetical protein BKA69DRAFT_838461 [Paraphysoderma sedebokerense]|nr:hypothetical protein BKA69DRAFT_838461 [Paraphysoderma sedebokerense]
MKNPPSKPPFSASNSRTSKNSVSTSRYSQTGTGKARHGSAGSGHKDISSSKNLSQPKNLKSSMSNLHSTSKSLSNPSHRSSSPGLTSKDDADSDFIRVQSNPTLSKSPQSQLAGSPLRRKSSSTTNSFGSEPTSSVLNKTFTSSSDTLKEDDENLSSSSEVYPGLQFGDDNVENENNIRILNRKILDLEISNKALSALSHDLETTVKNQNEYIQQLQDYIQSFMNSKDDETAEVNLDMDGQEGETFRVEEDDVNKEERHTEDVSRS